MDYRNDIIQDELKSISPTLAQIARVKVFAVPPFYFEQLPLKILQLIKADNEHLSTTFSIKNPYRVPTGYFEDLAGAILQKVTTEQDTDNGVAAELEIVAPLLNTITKKMVYSVPEGYFDTLRYSPGREVIKKKVAFGVVKSLYRYAAAAVIIGVLAMGAYLFTKPGTSPAGNDTANILVELEKVSDTEIATYLDNNNFAVDVHSTNIYLNEELPIQEYIKNLSEDEIRSFLKENGALKKEI